MLTNSKIALSVALVLATASAAMAAPKNAVRHQTAITPSVIWQRHSTTCVLLYHCVKAFNFVTDAQRAAYAACFGKTPAMKSGYPGSCYESGAD